MGVFTPQLVGMRLRFMRLLHFYIRLAGVCVLIRAGIMCFKLEGTFLQSTEMLGNTAYIFLYAVLPSLPICMSAEEVDWEADHSKTPAGEKQNHFTTLTVRTYVWIVTN